MKLLERQLAASLLRVAWACMCVRVSARTPRGAHTMQTRSMPARKERGGVPSGEHERRGGGSVARRSSRTMSVRRVSALINQKARGPRREKRNERRKAPFMMRLHTSI